MVFLTCKEHTWRKVAIKVGICQDRDVLTCSSSCRIRQQTQLYDKGKTSCKQKGRLLSLTSIRAVAGAQAYNLTCHTRDGDFFHICEYFYSEEERKQQLSSFFMLVFLCITLNKQMHSCVLNAHGKPPQSHLSRRRINHGAGSGNEGDKSLR